MTIGNKLSKVFLKVQLDGFSPFVALEKGAIKKEGWVETLNFAHCETHLYGGACQSDLGSNWLPSSLEKEVSLLNFWMLTLASKT